MHKFLQANVLILILLNSGNVFNYLVQLVLGRSLTPEEFGVFNSLNSLNVVLTAPVAVLPMVIARFTILQADEGPGGVRSLIEGSCRVLFWASGLLFLGGVLALPWLKAYLHVEASLPFLILLVNMVLSLFSPVFYGVLQGLRRFLSFGLSANVLMGGRFVGVLLFVPLLGWGVNGGLLAGVAGAILSLLACFWFLRDLWRVPRVPLNPAIAGEMLRYTLPVFFSTSALLVMGNVDLVLVRHYCPQEAGMYATATVLGRIAYFLPSVLIYVIFPEAAQAKKDATENHGILWFSVMLTGLLGGGVALACFFWPAPLIGFLFGANYVEAAPLLTIVSAAMALLAVSNMLVTYQLARSEFGAVWILLLGVGLMVAWILFEHDSSRTIARILLSSTLFMLVGLLAVTLGKELRRWSSGTVPAGPRTP